MIQSDSSEILININELLSGNDFINKTKEGPQLNSNFSYHLPKFGINYQTNICNTESPLEWTCWISIDVHWLLSQGQNPT